MKKNLCLIFTVSMMLMPFTASAQEKQDLRQVYTKAEEAYQIGQLDQTIELLEGNLNDFTGICVKAPCDWFPSVISLKMTRICLKSMRVRC